MMAKKSPHRCHDTRDMLFNYRRQELTELDTALFEDAMMQCEACRKHVGRLIEIMNLAQSAPAETFLDHKTDPLWADDLFASISSELKAVPAPTQTTNVIDLEQARALRTSTANLSAQPLPGEDTQDHDTPQPPSAWPKLLLALAALAILGLGLALLWHTTSHDPDPVTSSPSVAMTDLPPAPKEVAKPEPSEPLIQEKPPEVSDAVATLPLRPERSADDAVRIFPSPGALWQLSHQDLTHTLEITQGTLLVEFVPARPGKERLVVATAGMKVQVLGTLFYVSTPAAQNPQVGVITGKVKVETKAHGSFTLSDDQEIVLDQAPAVQAIDPEAKSRWTKVVSVQTHQHALKTAALEQLRRTQEEAKERTRQEELGSLRQSAKLALENRHYDEGAKLYEALLAKLPASHHESATVRLELVRLYMRHLKEKERAIAHLRTFILRHPQDVAAPSATRQLCRLLDTAASHEPLCAP